MILCSLHDSEEEEEEEEEARKNNIYSIIKLLFSEHSIWFAWILRAKWIWSMKINEIADFVLKC